MFRPPFIYYPPVPRIRAQFIGGGLKILKDLVASPTGVSNSNTICLDKNPVLFDTAPSLRNNLDIFTIPQRISAYLYFVNINK